MGRGEMGVDDWNEIMKPANNKKSIRSKMKKKAKCIRKRQGCNDCWRGCKITFNYDGKTMNLFPLVCPFFDSLDGTNSKEIHWAIKE